MTCYPPRLVDHLLCVSSVLRASEHTAIDTIKRRERCYKTKRLSKAPVVVQCGQDNRQRLGVVEKSPWRVARGHGNLLVLAGSHQPHPSSWTIF